MGKMPEIHRAKLDALIADLDRELDDLGRPFVPEIQERVIQFIEPFIDEVESGRIKPSSFLGNTIQNFWREISELIILKFPDEHRPMMKNEDGRTKAKFKWDKGYVHDVCFKYDCYTKNEVTPAYKKIYAWRSAKNKRSSDEAKHRTGESFEWGIPEYDKLYELALSCIRKRGTVESDNDRCVRLIYALSFFTGRRPWEEVGRISVFREAEPSEDVIFPEHADDWLEVEGIGKKSNDHDDKLIIPVFNISSAELVEAMIELRMIESSKTWFSMDREQGKALSTKVQGSLQRNWERFRDKEIDPIFERCYSHGFAFEHNRSKGKGAARFNAYDLRRMYCSYGFWRYNQWSVENGYEPWKDPVRWARTYLGHVESKSNEQTLTYLGFDFKGDDDLRQQSGLKPNPMGVRHAITS